MALHQPLEYATVEADRFVKWNSKQKFPINTNDMLFAQKNKQACALSVGEKQNLIIQWRYNAEEVATNAILTMMYVGS